MRQQTACYFIQAIIVSIFLLFISSAPVFAQANNTVPLACNTQNSPSLWFVYPVILLILFFLFISLVMVKKSLGKWSLQDALSEECKFQKPGSDETIELTPSTSRLVAFVGMIAIVVLFIGFGIFALYRFAVCGTIDTVSIQSVSSFLFSGLSLFAPYAVNVSASALKAFTGGKD